MIVTAKNDRYYSTLRRGWFARRYLYWVVANAQTAIAIQRVARGFLGRRT